VRPALVSWCPPVRAGGNAFRRRYGIGPRLLSASEDGESLRYEYVDGLPILEHCQLPSSTRDVVLDIFQVRGGPLFWAHAP
jgi:hypothetical protein